MIYFIFYVIFFDALYFVIASIFIARGSTNIKNMYGEMEWTCLTPLVRLKPSDIYPLFIFPAFNVSISNF